MALPPGLLLNPATGELSGVPTVAGDYVIALKVRDALGSVREISDSLTINPYTPMVWAGVMGALMATRPATHVTLNLTNGLGPYTFQVFSGSLPDGMTLDTSTGVVSGTPTTPGGYAFLLRAIDTLSQHADLVVAGTVIDNLTIEYDGTAQGTVGVGMTDECIQAGGTIDFAYAVHSGTLPAGLILDDLIGLYTGVPTAPSSATVVIRATDANGFTADATINFDIAAFPKLTGALPHGTAGKAYSASLTGALGHTPYSWSMTTLGGSGLSINASTGVISGTPAAATNSYILDVLMIDALGNHVEKVQTIVIAAALAISGGYSATNARNAVYSTFSPTVTGGWSPFTFDISAGALPTGLSLNASTGVISGTTTAQGTFTATLRVTDSDGSTATMAFNVVVAGDLSITGSAPNFGTTTVAYTGDTLAGSGGSTPYTWSISSGSLPPGIVLNTSTGHLSGTPTSTGSFTATVKLIDANASFATVSVPITVAAFPHMTGSMPDGSNGTPFSGQYSSSGGHAPLVYSISAGALPTGLSLNTSTGAVTGTPTANGSFTFTIKLTDNHANFTTRAATVVIYAAPSISGSVSSAAEGGIAYSDTSLSASGGSTPLSWSVQGTLPPGLSLNAGTGAISGTPSAVGTYAFTVKVTDALGITATSSQSITVAAHVAFANTPRTSATRGVAYSSTATATGGSGSYVWTLGGTPPAGLSINSSTGVLSGTPTTAATYGFSVTVTDALGATATASVTITVAVPVSISGTAPKATKGVAYSFTPTRTGGWGPFLWSVDTLPGGMTFNSSTGTISGVAADATDTSYTVHYTITDQVAGGGSTDTLTVTIASNLPPTLTLNYPGGTVGESYSGTVTANEGWPGYTYSKASGTLPPGLSLNASTGALTGTPSTAGTYSFVIRLTDTQGNTVDVGSLRPIHSALAISGVFATSAKVGVAYSSTISTSGGWPGYTYSKPSGTLPTSLSLSSAGVLSGTPTVAGTYNFTVRSTDSIGGFVDKAMAVVVAASSAALNVNASPNPADDFVVTAPGTTVTASRTATATANGGTGSGYTYAWTFVSRTVNEGTSVAFVASGASTASLHLSLTSSPGPSGTHSITEVWRCTAHDSGSGVDTVDVSFTFEIDSSA